jgi:hypothetical protein
VPAPKARKGPTACGETLSKGEALPGNPAFVASKYSLRIQFLERRFLLEPHIAELIASLAFGEARP